MGLGTRLDEAAVGGTPTVQPGLAALFAPSYLRRTLFTSVFRLCRNTPFFAISTFAPQVPAAVGASDDGISEVMLNVFLPAGCPSGVWLIGRVGRRQLLIWPFVVTTTALPALGLWPFGPQWMIAAGGSAPRSSLGVPVGLTPPVHNPSRTG